MKSKVLVFWCGAVIVVVGYLLGADDDNPNKFNETSGLNNPPKIISKPSQTPTPPKPLPELQLPTKKPRPLQIMSPKPKVKKVVAINLNPQIMGQKYISKNSVNVRSLPTIKSAKLANLKLNTAVNYYKKDKNWYKIKIPNSQKYGWIRGDLLANSKKKPKTNTILSPKTITKSGPIRGPYTGRCDCPYDFAKNGSKCGGRSAYSRPGGRSPQCYW